MKFPKIVQRLRSQLAKLDRRLAKHDEPPPEAGPAPVDPTILTIQVEKAMSNGARAHVVTVWQGVVESRKVLMKFSVPSGTGLTCSHPWTPIVINGARIMKIDIFSDLAKPAPQRRGPP